MEGNMARKILYGSLIGLSVILTVLSLVGIGAAWAYNEPLTRLGLARLNEIDQELGQAQTTLQSAELEMERAVRILEDVEIALAALTQKTTQASDTLHAFGETLDETLIPGLRTASEKIDQVRVALQGLLTTLETINSASFLNLEIPGEELLAGLIDAADRLDGDIASIEQVADQASTFLSDVEYVLRGDVGETQRHVEELLGVVSMYESRIGGWRAKLAETESGLPGWVDRTCIGLTVFLLWFGLSQFGLFLHGLTGWRGGNPLAVLRSPGGAGGS